MLLTILTVASFAVFFSMIFDAIGAAIARSKRQAEAERAAKAWDAARDRELNGPIEELVAQYEQAKAAARAHGFEGWHEHERDRLYWLLCQRGARPIRK